MIPPLHHALKRLLPALLLGATLLGCRQIPPPENPIKDAALLRAAVDARVEQVSTARFKEVVFEYYGEERIKVRQLILVQYPDKLRVQTRMPGSDEIINLLVSDGERFAMHRRDTNEYLTGAPTRENINKLIPLDLSARDVVRVMLGGAPWDRVMQEQVSTALSWDGRRGHYLLTTQTRQRGALQIRVRPTDFAVLEVREEDAEGELVYAYTTRDWGPQQPISLPDWRRFEWPREKIDFSVDVGETELEIPLPDTLFVFTPPPGSRIIEMGGDG